MPYVITTKTPPKGTPRTRTAYDMWGTESRVAVATLEDVGEHLFFEMAERPRYTLGEAARISNEIAAVNESGGTIGPLPDGTIIEVEPVSLDHLWEMAGAPEDQAVRTVDVLAAFNAS